MYTILDGTRTVLAESGLPMKYWADAVWTVVYIWNLLPNSRQSKAIPAELWTRQHQDISYLWPFGYTSYAHIPLDLSFSKLNPRSVKTALLGYFGYNRYKLLDKNTSTIFKSRDIIFKEEITHLVKQLTPTMLGKITNYEVLLIIINWFYSSIITNDSINITLYSLN